MLLKVGFFPRIVVVAGVMACIELASCVHRRNGPASLGNGFSFANLAACPDLVYPPLAFEAVTEGDTQIRFSVAASGEVTALSIQSESGETEAHHALDREALKFARSCKFGPVRGEFIGAFRWRLAGSTSRILKVSNPELAKRCSNFLDVIKSARYPRDALRLKLEGDVLIEFRLQDGVPTKVRAVVSTHPYFSEAAVETVSKLRCEWSDAVFYWPMSYRL